MGTYTDLITNDEQSPMDPPKGETANAPAPKIKKMETTKKKLASKNAHMHANKHVVKQTSKRTSLQVTMHAYIQQYLNEKATQGFTFRYPPQLLEELEDVIYEVRKKHRQKLPKNTIAVLALAFVMKDYVENGEDSILYRALLAQ